MGALVASALLFAPAANAATDVNVVNSDVKNVENASTFTSWHQGYANPNGAKVTVNGLELSGGPSQVTKGYTDNSNTLNGNKNFDLATKITGSKFTATAGTANLQVPIFYSTGNGVKYTTLRSLNDQGSRVKTSDLWASSSAIDAAGETADVAKDAYVPLTSILAAVGDNYKVIAFGVQADNNATVTDITWDGVTYKFKDPIDKTASKVDIYRVHPKSGKITTKNTVSFYATVTIDGKPAPSRTVITGYAKGKKVATGKVNSKGKVKLVVKGKLPKGSSTLKAEYAGSPTIAASSDSLKVKVIKKK